MYCNFFHLTCKPFALVPDTSFIYQHPRYVQALGSLVYGITEGDGFLVLSGDAGTGKTTLCRRLLQELDDCDTAYLFNPPVSVDELIRAVLLDLGVAAPAGAKPELLDRLNAFLLERAALGRTVVLIIDEAQDLPAEVLEQIRLLSNLETQTRKLLQIVLAGQPELLDTIRRHELRQLQQRIAIHVHLDRFSPAETARYLTFRLNRAGSDGTLRFSRAAIRAIARLSRGIPRSINLLAERAMLAAYAHQTCRITRRLVRVAALDLGVAVSRARMNRCARIGGRLALVCLICVLAGVAGRSASSLLPRGAPSAVTPVAHAFDPAGILRTTAPPARYAALATLLRSWQIPIDLLTARAAHLGAPKSVDLAAEAQHFGMQVTSFRTTLAQLQRLGLSCLVSISEPVAHTAVLADMDNTTITLHDPLRGVVVMPRPRFARIWDCRVVVIYRDFDQLNYTLQPGQHHGAIPRLRQSLRAVRLLTTDNDTTVYDTELADAVKSLQRTFDLQADGIFGPRSILGLYRLRYDDRMPLFSHAVTAEEAS